MARLPEVKYGYASEIIPYIKGLLAGDTADGLTPEQQAQNNQIWDRLGRGATASPHRMGPPMPMAHHAQAAPTGLLSTPLPPRRPDGLGMPAPTTWADPGAIENAARANNTLNAAQPDEESMQMFYRSQGIGVPRRNFGPMLNEAMPVIDKGPMPMQQPPMRQQPPMGQSPMMPPSFALNPWGWWNGQR